MKFKKRCLLVLTSVAFLAFCYFGGSRLKSDLCIKWRKDLIRSHFQHDLPNPIPIPPAHYLLDHSKCRMETCFDFTKCNNFKIYVYPDDERLPPSDQYSKILEPIRRSKYYTEDPGEACLFVLSLDTLNRDEKDEVSFVRNLPDKLSRLQYWNGGTNHLVFNLYSGTYPDYAETALKFNVGRAILAKASMSEEFYRSGFDVSLPLFGKSHPERGSDALTTMSNPFPVTKKYTMSFKGKRYVYGIGSETRNSLYHLHNGKDLVLLTTCKHNGDDWKKYADKRCDEDNAEYDRWDFEELNGNSTFCLVPRGRRLGSYRFLETLRAACIPVLLSNGWRLPFAEVIDWSEATLEADERLLLQVPEILNSVPAARVFAMRQQTQILYDRYLSSVEKIVDTTLEIIKQRIWRHTYQEGLVWNSDPGALLTLPEFSDSLSHFPFHFGEEQQQLKAPNAAAAATGCEKFTAVIYTTLTSASTSSKVASGVHLSAPIFKLARNVAASNFAQQIIVIWTSEKPPPPTHQWPFVGGRSNVPIRVIHQPHANISQRFRPELDIPTDAILSLDEDASLTTEEMDFAFGVWCHFPDRLVGFPSRSHFWDDRKHQWVYTSKWGNDYSMILTGAAFYHKYYNVLFNQVLSAGLRDLVDRYSNCEDILMNFLVSHVTRRPPIKVTQRKQYKETPPSGVKSPWNDPGHFAQRQNCTNTFTAVFGYMPLLKSSTRFDPVLYKDAVANSRKKYRKLESVPINTGAAASASGSGANSNTNSKN